MTLATMMHGCFGLLAVLLFLEARRAHRHAPAPRAGQVGDDEFQTWMIVRWDDEFGHPTSPCTRGPVAHEMTARNQRHESPGADRPAPAAQRNR